MTPCSACGCLWSDEGFYTYEGKIQQPCRVCRCDKSSIYYVNNAEAKRAKRRQAYYANLEASREYDRNRKRRYAQASAISVLS